MGLHVFDGNRAYLLGYEPRQPFIQRHAKLADTTRAKSEGRGEHQVGAIRLQQICRANVGVESAGNQCHHIHQRFRRLAAFGRQVIDFIEREHLTGSTGGRHRSALRVIDVFTYRIFAYRAHRCHWSTPLQGKRRLTAPGKNAEVKK